MTTTTAYSWSASDLVSPFFLVEVWQQPLYGGRSTITDASVRNGLKAEQLLQKVEVQAGAFYSSCATTINTAALLAYYLFI